MAKIVTTMLITIARIIFTAIARLFVFVFHLPPFFGFALFSLFLLVVYGGEGEGVLWIISLH